VIFLKYPIKIITPVSTEPTTKAELKRHLKIYDDGYNDGQGETIVSQNAGAGTVIGTSVDILGCEATVYVNVGNVYAGGKLDCTIQHSDDNVTFTTYSTFAQITAIGQNSKSYTGGKRYIKVVGVVSVNNVVFSANVQYLAGDPVTDAELDDIIIRAREEAEEITRRAFAPQTLEYSLDKFPDTNYINVPRPPLTSITTIKTYDSVGTSTALTPTTQYLVDTDSIPARILLPYGGVWASGADYPIRPIRITYVAGYTTLPQRLKRILLYHCGLLYKYRDIAIPEVEYKALINYYNFYRVEHFGGE
jgi:uncharacterized phiE125 gp8 family phage protein